MLYKANPGEDSPAPLQGEPHPEDTARAVEAIRDLICREEGLTPTPRATAPAAPAPAPQTARAKRSETAKTEAPKTRQKAEEPAPRAAKPRKPAPSFQPDWRISGAILLLAVMLWRPWLLPALIMLTIAICAIIYFSLGPDRVADIAARWHARLQRRNPDRAARVRALANRVSARLERWARVLPARWTEGLYFPVFESATDDDALPDPFARLMPQERLFVK